MNKLQSFTEQSVSFLRQWLNEDRITDPKKMVTNEDIKHWLKPSGTAVEEECECVKICGSVPFHCSCHCHSNPKPQEEQQECFVEGCTNKRAGAGRNGRLKSRCGKHIKKKTQTILSEPQEEKICSKLHCHDVGCCRCPDCHSKDKPQPILEIESTTLDGFLDNARQHTSYRNKINELIKAHNNQIGK